MFLKLYAKFCSLESKYNTDNINTAEIGNDKSEDIVMSDNNDDNPAMSDNNSGRSQK